MQEMQEMQEMREAGDAGDAGDAGRWLSVRELGLGSKEVGDRSTSNDFTTASWRRIQEGACERGRSLHHVPPQTFPCLKLFNINVQKYCRMSKNISL